MTNILSESLSEFIPKDGIYKYFINGIWTESKSGNTIDIYSPVDEKLIGKVQAITTDEAKDLMEDANSAFPSWANETMDKRAEIIRRAAKIMEESKDILIKILTWEIGKTYEDAKEEVIRTARLIEYYAEEGRRIHNESLYSEYFPGYNNKKIGITKRVPLGVILAIPPFNYPINEGAPKIVGALITGNSVVLKPSTQGVISSLYMVECFRLAGLPAGVLNVATGKSSEIGDELVKHKHVKAINFTGSTQTAQHIRQIMGLVPLIAGLGGKDASIVLSDAEMTNTISEIAKGAFGYAGQRCTAIKRVLVEETIADEFISKFVEYVKTNYILKDPREQDSTMGPVINQHTVDYLNELKADALSKGAKTVLDGEVNGLYYPCTILDMVTSDMKIAWEEPFGPILPIIRIKDKEDAIRVANESEYGLQASVFTKDINNAFYIAEKLDVGTVQINGKDSRGPDHFPFIGVKNSGLGQVQGAKYLIESMTRIKTIVVNKGY